MRLRTNLVVSGLLAPILVVARDGQAQCSNVTYPLPQTGAQISAFAAVDTYVQNWVKSGSNAVHAATLAIEYDKKLVYERGFGYQDNQCTQQILPDARMRMASNSPGLTALALQQVVADGTDGLTASTTVTSYLKKYLNSTYAPNTPTEQLPAGGSTSANVNAITIADLYNQASCVNDNDGNTLDNVNLGVTLGLGRAVTAAERTVYAWANPAFMNSNCTPGQSSGFSHFNYEIGGLVVALAQWSVAGKPSNSSPLNVSFYEGTGYYYGQYLDTVLGPMMGAMFYQASNDPTQPLPNEIWYDSTGLTPATQCAQWKPGFWQCQFNGQNQQDLIANAYSLDYYARPGSGTVVDSARDYARFMASYDWNHTTSLLTNPTSTTYANPPGSGVGSLPGTFTEAMDGWVQYPPGSGTYHLYNWVLLTNKQGVSDFNSYNGSATFQQVLTNGRSGVFDQNAMTTDLYNHYVITNESVNEPIFLNGGGKGGIDPINFMNGVGSNLTYSSNVFPPYNTGWSPNFLWRVQPDAEGLGFYMLTNEGDTSGMLANTDDDSYVEYLPPNNTFFSTYWTVNPATTASQAISGRYFQPNVLNVHGETNLPPSQPVGTVLQSAVSPSDPSAQWSLTQLPSGLCTNAVTEQACMCGSGSSTCPIYHAQPSWQSVGGAGACATAVASGWVIGCGNDAIYFWNASINAFSQAPGAATIISVDLNGNPWVINSNGSLYNGGTGGFNYFSTPWAVSSVASGTTAPETWVIRQSDNSIWNWSGSSWQQVPGSFGSKIAVFSDVPDACGHHVPWVINAQNNIYRYSEAANNCQFPGSFSQVGGSAAAVDISTDFVVGTDGDMFEWSPGTQTFRSNYRGDGSYSGLPSGAATRIGTWTNGLFAIVPSSGAIYMYKP